MERQQARQRVRWTAEQIRELIERDEPVRSAVMVWSLFPV